MASVQDIINSIERMAPLHLAEDWDNPGLMVGDRTQNVTGIVTSLDPAEAVVDFAIANDCNLVITHHPFIFKGMKQIDLNSPQGRIIRKLVKHDIALYSAHTNLDIASGGLNDMLAERIGLTNVRGFVKTRSERYMKLVTFVPATHAGAVRAALGAVGAGHIGNYSDCSFTTTGEGRFKGAADTSPFLGEPGQLEVAEEQRIETIVSKQRLGKAIEVLLAAHPYEEVAYDVYELAGPTKDSYLGRIGELPESMNLDEFRDYLQECLPHAILRFGGVPCESIQTVALCSGGGADFIGQAVAMKADVYLTGDVKYHDAQRAKEAGILVADAGHFGTEEIVADGLVAFLRDEQEKLQWGDMNIVAHHEQEDFFFL